MNGILHPQARWSTIAAPNFQDHFWPLRQAGHAGHDNPRVVKKNIAYQPAFVLINVFWIGTLNVAKAVD
jgi:hypothetical protein